MNKVIVFSFGFLYLRDRKLIHTKKIKNNSIRPKFLVLYSFLGCPKLSHVSKFKSHKLSNFSIMPLLYFSEHLKTQNYVLYLRANLENFIYFYWRHKSLNDVPLQSWVFEIWLIIWENYSMLPEHNNAYFILLCERRVPPRI